MFGASENYLHSRNQRLRSRAILTRALLKEGFTVRAKTGIAYMLAGDVKFDPKSGQLSTTEFPAHYMIYAPGVTKLRYRMSKGSNDAWPAVCLFRIFRWPKDGLHYRDG